MLRIINSYKKEDTESAEMIQVSQWGEAYIGYSHQGDYEIIQEPRGKIKEHWDKRNKSRLRRTPIPLPIGGVFIPRWWMYHHVPVMVPGVQGPPPPKPFNAVEKVNRIFKDIQRVNPNDPLSLLSFINEWGPLGVGIPEDPSFDFNGVLLSAQWIKRFQNMIKLYEAISTKKKLIMSDTDLNIILPVKGSTLAPNGTYQYSLWPHPHYKIHKEKELSSTATSFRRFTPWHNFITLFMSSGCKVFPGLRPVGTGLRSVFGHRDINTTLRYSHLAPDHLRNAINQIGTDTKTDTVGNEEVNNEIKGSSEPADNIEESNWLGDEGSNLDRQIQNKLKANLCISLTP